MSFKELQFENNENFPQDIQDKVDHYSQESEVTDP